LQGITPLNATQLGFEALPGSQLPRFLGELFREVFALDGGILPNPNERIVSEIRALLLCFYKYEVPFSSLQEQQVVASFIKAEQELVSVTETLQSLSDGVKTNYRYLAAEGRTLSSTEVVARDARRRLYRLFEHFDCRDINPRHGPGAVATKQTLWNKYLWSNVSDKITAVYPLDEYFYASQGAVCDQFRGFSALGSATLPAKIVLVPKDSRGPRLISCEPVDFQWIQQGLGRAIVRHVESHPATKWNVFFTDQGPNQRGALLGSMTGRYATLDLKEASDRVSLELVRLLFPEPLLEALESCRTEATVAPDGTEIKLLKFAPMGSCLCFPVMALTIWSLLTAAAPDEDTRESILVYGDDVIVPTAYAENAMTVLESFGLKINRDKSCIQGRFRESCGVDAFNGVCVTPVRFRTVWTESPSADAFASWIEYANALKVRNYHVTYDLIVRWLEDLYGPLPYKGMGLTCPSTHEATHGSERIKRRWNRHLQRYQYLVTVLSAPVVTRQIDGWAMLLRWFTEGRNYPSPIDELAQLGSISRPLPWELSETIEVQTAFRVRSYTRRGTSMLVKRWR
jgi:hypothetical protein